MVSKRTQMRFCESENRGSFFESQKYWKERETYGIRFELNTEYKVHF